MLQVKIHQKVLRGQLLVHPDKNIIPIHSPTSGYIKDILFFTTSNNQKKIKIIITSDKKDNWINLKSIKYYKEYTPKKLIEIIDRAGVVGLGGGQFPSSKKLKLSINKVHTLIVNAVESEPYITADSCLIDNYIEEVIIGCEIISWIVKIKHVLIAITAENVLSLKKIQKILKKKDILKFVL